MRTLTGNILDTYSEPVNGAPVVMQLEVDGRAETVYWRRASFNGWIDLHGSGIAVGTEVTVQVNHVNVVEYVVEEPEDA